MVDITTILTLTLLVLSVAIIISFALVMYVGFRMQNPPLSVSIDRNHSGVFFPGLRGPQHQVLPGILQSPR